MIYFGNNHAGAHAWTSLDLQYYRCLGQDHSSSWGLICNTAGSSPYAALNLKWVPVSATITNSNARVVTLNAPDWQASNSYTCSSASPCAIGPTSNNAAGYNYISLANCTSSGTPPSFSQTFPPTSGTTDNTCSWVNVGGVLTASPNPGVSFGFLPATPDTTGTTSSYTDAFDGLGSTGYPFRDMPGRVHNQVLNSDIEWNNGGAEAPSQIFGTDSATSTYVQQNREYYDAQTSGCSSNQTTGVCRGTLASRAASCTQGVWYVATDQGSWNSSGNGFGSDVAYQCGASAWPGSATYTPFGYPDSLLGAPSQLPHSALPEEATLPARL